MKLLITKDNKFIELQDSVVMKANDFGVWFWESFFSIDGKIVSVVNLDEYKEIYEDFKRVVYNKSKTTKQSLN
jgi:hypothetical protein